ncbi:short-chain dehydrogenase [Bryobacterales bacterium F-183]|nr:short-chain dehydrogenase [Bryobacterales bacterium F-183]
MRVSWAVVTGASSGIGREVALQLAARGLKLVLVARNAAALQQLATAIPGTQTRVLPLDLADPAGPAQLDEATRDLDVRVVVNSAGFGSGGPFVTSVLADELAMVDVNCRAVLGITHRFAQRLALEKQESVIVLLSSIVAFQGVARSANYAATKAYVQSLGEALALELSSTSVRVLTAIPGPTNSGFAARARMDLGNTADTAEQVAKDIVDAIFRPRATTVVPGRMGKILLYALSTAPRFLRVRIMKGIMASMTRRSSYT